MILTPPQARVLGSLVEKELTTPQQYPLTANALLLACNQASNRDPVVAYTQEQVGQALEELREQRLVRFVLPSHGRSAVRYRHVLDEVLALDRAPLALLAVLLLRGPQTAGELRTRTERMASFDDPGHVARELGRLAAMEDPLVARLARRPGQKEERWAELLQGPAAGEGDVIPATGAGTPPAGAVTPPAGAVAASAGPGLPTPGPTVGGDAGPVPLSPPADLADQVSALGRAVADLHREVDAQRLALDALRLELDRLREELGA